MSDEEEHIAEEILEDKLQKVNDDDNGTIEYLDMDLDTTAFSPDGCVAVLTAEDAEANLQTYSQVSVLKSSYAKEPRNKYSPIRPKPYRSCEKSNGDWCSVRVKQETSNEGARRTVDSKASGARTKRNNDELDLFFESMAKAVLNLPTRVQAQIKMEICKLVMGAEIKYSSDKWQQE